MKHCHVFCQSSRFTKKYLWPRVLRITLSCFWNKYHCHHYNQSNSLDWLSGYSRSKIIKKYSEILKLQSAGKNTNPSNIWWEKNLLKKIISLIRFTRTIFFQENVSVQRKNDWRISKGSFIYDERSSWSQGIRT